jgi:hypothetical protein
MESMNPNKRNYFYFKIIDFEGVFIYKRSHKILIIFKKEYTQIEIHLRKKSQH